MVETATLVYRGALEGHSNWVTSIATSEARPDILVTGSRDKSLMIWDLSEQTQESIGYAKRRLTGHSNFVQDVALSQDGVYAVSASWDHTLRLWNLETGKTMKLFKGHTKDVMSVTFSPNNTQIVSASRDKTIKIWNTLAECKFTIDQKSHTEWINCVRFSPAVTPLLVSAGSDKMVKIWDLAKVSEAKSSFVGDTCEVRCVTVSPDGTLCASGGKEGNIKLWDLNNSDKLYSLDASDPIHALVFNPTKYWLCAATDKSIKIWDLETKTVVGDLQPEVTEQKKIPHCLCLAWSHDGSTLYGGFTDNKIRAWQVSGVSGHADFAPAA